jgi:transposase
MKKAILILVPVTLVWLVIRNQKRSIAMDTTKAKKIKKINNKTVVAALDIGKSFHYGYFRAPNGNDVTPFRFNNSKSSYEMFWNALCQFKQKEGLEEIVIGFESTGPYAEPLFHFLREKPAHLVQVNPVHTKRIKELTGNSPNKTDKKDPRVIADVIFLGHSLTLVVPEGPAAQLRRLTQARERAVKSRTAMMNQLQHLFFVIFPEFSEVLSVSSKSAKYIIKHYTTPEAICALGLESISKILRKISRGRIGQDRAKELYRAAQSSVGISEGKQSIVFEVGYLVAQIENQDQFIASVEDQMLTYLKQIPYSQNILSIKGIGPVTAAGLIGEVGDFRKFDTISEMMKLAGLDLYEISSGKRNGQRRISKRGRALIRKLLYYAALNVVRKNGIMHDSYHRMLDRGQLKMKALIAITRKLLGLIFALVRDDTQYVENHAGNHHCRLAA